MDVCDSATARVARRRRRIRLTIEQDLTIIVCEEPRQNVEKGALSCAVLADQRMNLAGATRDTAKTAMENLLNRYGHEIDGVFTPNESSTAGALLALEDAGKAGKVRFVGFDTSDMFVKAMREGKLQGIVVQNPFRMGELGVQTLVDHLLGKKNVPKRVDTGVTLITPANLDTPQSQELLHPPLDKYLK